MKSPYSDEYQEFVYKIIRYSPGRGFEQLISEKDLTTLVQNSGKVERYNLAQKTPDKASSLMLRPVE